MPIRPSTPKSDSCLADCDSRSGSLSQSPVLAAPKLLCVTEQEPSWVSLTAAMSAAGVAPPRIVWVSTAREALVRARDDTFDCLLVNVPPTGGLFSAEDDPLAFVRALRTAGSENPVVLVARWLTDSEWLEACDLDCDVFVSPRGWESRALGAVVKRAVLRGELARENQRLTTANHRRLLRERDESEQLLAQQRQIISELESLPELNRDRELSSVAGRDRDASLQASLAKNSVAAIADQYAGLLRSYVLMGCGTLAADIAAMADQLVEARVAPQEALQLHLECVESLLKGLGNRSARHVVARADLLAVEVMTHLAHRSQRAAGSSAIGRSAFLSNSALRNVSGASGIDLSDRNRSTRATAFGRAADGPSPEAASA